MQSSDELFELRSEIADVKKQLNGANSEAVNTALQASLAALREKEVLIMRGKLVLGA
jgi:hypothetical protein